MLVLSRRIEESIQIGDTITVTVLEIQGGKVRLGITAPRGVPIYREELMPLVRQRQAETLPEIHDLGGEAGGA